MIRTTYRPRRSNAVALLVLALLVALAVTLGGVILAVTL